MIYPIYRLGLAIQPSLMNLWSYPEDSGETLPKITGKDDVPEGEEEHNEAEAI